MILTTILDQSSEIKPDLFVKKELPINLQHIKKTAKHIEDKQKVKTKDTKNIQKNDILNKQALQENEKATKKSVDLRKTVINENDMKSFLYMMVPGMSNYFEKARGKISYKEPEESHYKKYLKNQEKKKFDIFVDKKV